MNTLAPFDIVLSEIIKRKRVEIPNILLTEKLFSDKAKKTMRETKKFKFNDMNIDFRDYISELVYLKLFIKTKEEKSLIDFTKCTTIIKITDLNDQVFYMYIKLYLKCNRHEPKYRILYSSSFDDLVTFIYKPKEIPDFLNSEAFVSKNDKTIEQNIVLKAYNETLIKNVEYKGKYIAIQSPDTLSGWVPFDGTINITIDFKNRNISAIISNVKYSTRYKEKHAFFANEIITKGSNTISIQINISNDGIDIYLKNDIETLKSFWLKEEIVIS
jgi:hypothetical protein